MKTELIKMHEREDFYLFRVVGQKDGKILLHFVDFLVNEREFEDFDALHIYADDFRELYKVVFWKPFFTRKETQHHESYVALER